MNKEARIFCEFEGIALDKQITVEQLESIDEQLAELAELLMLVVEDGASIGFLPPLKYPDAAEYWGTVLSPNVVLFAAAINKKIVGSVQLPREGDPSNRLYASIGFMESGRIPNYARSANGELLASIFYYKELL